MAGRRTVLMTEPVCLIENDEDGRLRVVPSSQEILDQIDQHVVVVSVVGLYRTGKSYLMNKLSGGRTKGFALGSTIQSKTKGIWMWCVPHPCNPDVTLVLLDTEGLGDVEKGDESNDNWIFALAVLLSSTLVYNSMGTIDNHALERLSYVTELTEHIKVKSHQTDMDDSKYKTFFPSFVWAVRDFNLLLEIDGQPITSDQYLENALQLKSGHSRKIQDYNLPRSCLRNYFTSRSCFVFERPANSRMMRHLQDLTDADLNPCFVQQTRRFCEHIFTKAETKALMGGVRVTGRLLGNLAETYVAAIRSGQIPCLENAVVALSRIENSAAVERARVHYEKKMAEFVAYPTDTQEELSEIHGSVEKEALAVFMQSAFKDDDQEYHARLTTLLLEEYKKIREKNYQESQKVCEDKIRRIFADLEEQLRSGSYMTPGGYREYCRDLTTMTSEYRSEGGMGVKAEEVLKVYLQGKASIGQAILAADESLTEAERRAEEEKARRVVAESEVRALEEKVSALQRLLVDQQKKNEENINQLREKTEKDFRNAMAERDRVLQAKLQALNVFFKGSSFIPQADKKLTEYEKKIQEGMKREAVLEQEKKALEEKKAEMERTMEEDRRSQEERMRQMEEKMKAVFDQEQRTTTIVTPETSTECADFGQYRLQCSHAGLFQCSLTGLVFLMEGEGEVLYSTVQWDEGLLHSTGRSPAGPLFSIDCPQGRVRQLHLPHCEVLSGDGPGSLSVAHVTGDSMEVVQPLRVTDTHVVVNITDLSFWGILRWFTPGCFNIRGQVLPFLESRGRWSVLNLVIQPSNVPLNEVKKQNTDMTYIHVCPDCTLAQGGTYSLHCNLKEKPTIQPKHGKVYWDYGPNYHPTFQVFLQADTERVELRLLEGEVDGDQVWVGFIPLVPGAVLEAGAEGGAEGGPLAERPSGSAEEQLRSVRTEIVNRVSGPVLESLLDTLQHRRVLNDLEVGSVKVKPVNAEKARAIIDMVLRKGPKACSIMKTCLIELDTHLCRTLLLH